MATTIIHQTPPAAETMRNRVNPVINAGPTKGPVAAERVDVSKVNPETLRPAQPQQKPVAGREPTQQGAARELHVDEVKKAEPQTETHTEEVSQETEQGKKPSSSLSVDDLKKYTAMSDEDWEKAKENGLTVGDIEKIEQERLTSAKDDERNKTGRDDAAEVAGRMNDPDWGKPLDDKFDIQQGDFLEFLMKDIVLASVSYAGNKVTGSAGYLLYKGTSLAYHAAGDKYKKHKERKAVEAKKARDERKKIREQMVNDTLPSDLITQNDCCGAFAKITLDLRRRMIDNILKDKQLQHAQEINSMAAAVIRGGVTFNADNTVTYTYQDSNDKTVTATNKPTTQEYQMLVALDRSVTEALRNAGANGDPKKEQEVRDATAQERLVYFEQLALMREQSLLYAANYTAAKLMSAATTMTPKEIVEFSKKINASFPEIAYGEAMVSFYKHVEDINHRESGAFKGDDKTSAVNAVVNASEKSLRTVAKQVNDGKYAESYTKANKKDPVPENADFKKIELVGESKYAPGINDMDKNQKDLALNYMHADAVNGYVRYDAFAKENDSKKKEIEALEADKQGNDTKRENLQKLKDKLKKEFNTSNTQRDTARTTHFANIKAGNVK